MIEHDNPKVEHVTNKAILMARRNRAEAEGDWYTATLITNTLSEMGAFVTDKEAATLKRDADRKRRNSAKRNRRREKR